MLSLPGGLWMPEEAVVRDAQGHRPAWRRLAAALRPFERRLAARARRRGLTHLALARLQAARLVSGRRSRHGWHTVWRRIWPHPGIVERATPDDWPWPRRRLAFLAGRFRG